MNEKEFGEFIRQQRIKSGYKSQRHFSEVTGVSNGTIARIENGTQKPGVDTLRKISKCLNDIHYTELWKKAGYIKDVDVIKLSINNTDTAPVKKIKILSKEEFDKLKINPQLKLDTISKIRGRQELKQEQDELNYLKSLKQKREKENLPFYAFEPFYVPIINNIEEEKITIVPKNIEGYIAVPNLHKYKYKGSSFFVLSINMETMVGKRFNFEDKILVRLQSELENDKYFIFFVKGDGIYLMKVKKVETGNVWLFPVNENYEPMLFNKKHIRMIGKVVQVIFQL